MKIGAIISNNIGFKLLALFFAFITLVYVGETAKTDSGDSTVLQKLFWRSDVISKKMEIRPIFVGSTLSGYTFIKEEAKVSPESIVVIGPARHLSDKVHIFTKPIDLSEHTKSKTITVSLENISRAIKSQELTVQVYLPIQHEPVRRQR